MGSKRKLIPVQCVIPSTGLAPPGPSSCKHLSTKERNCPAHWAALAKLKKPAKEGNPTCDFYNEIYFVAIIESHVHVREAISTLYLVSPVVTL